MLQAAAKVRAPESFVPVGEVGEADANVGVRVLGRGGGRVLADERDGEVAARAGEGVKRGHARDLVRPQEAVVHAVHLGGVIGRGEMGLGLGIGLGIG